MEIKCKSTHPENYILLGNPEGQKQRANALVAEAVRQFPHHFESKQKSIMFELRYTPPFDKGFTELKRLQGIAAEVAGRRDEFRGYIIMDLSNYLGHPQEHYLKIALQFLVDMSDDWKYIFLVDNQNPKAAKELTGTVLAILLRDISCKVEENLDVRSPQALVSDICRSQGIHCSAPVEHFLQALLEQKDFAPDMLTALLRDISGSFGRRLTMDTLVDYFDNQIPVVKYMLNEKQFDRLVNTFAQKKEAFYGSKEAV